MEINERVHAELQRSGLVSREEHSIRTLVPRQDLTGADRTWAERYEVGNVLRYSRASKETGRMPALSGHNFAAFRFFWGSSASIGISKKIGRWDLSFLHSLSL